MSVGRISGPLLKSNLLRDGVDLAFENDLLYLDVNNLRVGINTNAPTHDLHVDGTTRTTFLEVTNQLDIGNITIIGNTISSNDPILYLNPTNNNIIYQDRITIDQIDIQNNVISANTPNTDLEIHITGTGSLKIFSNVLIDGDLHTTGNITADGNITIGDADTDNVIINADIGSNLIPNLTDTYDIGSPSKRWNDVWTNNFIATNVLATNIIVDGVDVSTEQGNIYYVSANGDDTNNGRHQNDPLATIEYALSLASSGDTVFIYPGTYQEDFPLTIPTGVTIKGMDLRNVIIEPTTSGTALDAFLLNGETTVEDITIRNFYFDNPNNTGYAFKFANNFEVTTRSPYIKNVSVITQGSVTSTLDPRGFDSGDAGRAVYLDGQVVSPTSKEASCLFSNVTFITPGVDSVILTNGVRAEFVNCFTYFANKAFFAITGTQGRSNHQHTILRFSSVTGTFTVGETVTYYDENNFVLASGTIEFIDGDRVGLTGYCPGFLKYSSRTDKIVIAFGNAQLSNTQTRFGSTSLSLDGVGDYLLSPSTIDYYFNLQDFTIEGWFRRTGGSTEQFLFDFRTQDTQDAPCLYWQGGTLIYYVNGTVRISGSAMPLTNEWYHVAISRTGTNTKIFVNGTQVGSTWTDTTNYIQSPFYIGCKYDQESVKFFTGYIDDVRISKGISRYSNNFIAPTSPNKNDSFTVLSLHFDGVNGSTSIEDDSAYNQNVQFSGGASASYIELADYHDFGAEVRIIGSATVYGNYGVWGDGPGVVMTLIGHNVAYVGSGKNQENDDLLTVQANEIVTINNADIHYTTINEHGDFRVGDLFYVNQHTGTVEFTNSIVNILGPNGISLTDGSNSTIIQPSKIETGNLRLSGNTIQSLFGEINFNSANDQINLQNNVNISGNLNVTGNVAIGGNITIGDNTTDSVTFVAGIDSNLIPRIDSTYNIGSSTLQWKDLYVRTGYIGDIEISTNIIRTTNTNANLELRANGTGAVSIERVDINENIISTNGVDNLIITPATTLDITASTTNVTGSFHVTNDVTIDGNTTLGNTTSDNVVFNARVNSNIIPKVSGIFNLGSPTNTWAIAHLSSAYIDDIYIDTNIIQTTVSNSNLELRANGTGAIRLEKIDVNENVISTNGTTNLEIRPATTLDIFADTNITGSLAVTGNVTIGGNITVGNQDTDNITFASDINSSLIPNIPVTYDLGSLSKRWRTLYSEKAQISDIEIDTNVIRTTVSNADLELRANGTGTIKFEDFTINLNTISTPTNTNMVLQPAGTGIVDINSNQAIRLPRGTTAERPGTPQAGMIRYNTSNNNYEGYDGTYWRVLNGMFDVDQNTYLVAELTPGANNNTFYFVSNGVQIADLTATRLNAIRVEVDDIVIDGNTISTINNKTLQFTAQGTGKIAFENFTFKNNVITNTVPNGVTELVHDGTGYFKIAGTTGFRIPVGDATQRPDTSLTPASFVGFTRYNTDDSRLEIFDGVTWQSAAGATSGITVAQAEDIAVQTVLMLG